MRRAAALAAALSCAFAAAADVPAGRAKAQPCVVCHGALGVSVMPDTPNLAGQPRIYVMSQLKQFRSGKRASEVMNVIAKPLTDDDIDALAEWFASIRVSASEPR
jgi:cytochrome c553